jgi:hypothetical protein
MPARGIFGVGAMIAALIAPHAQACSRPYPEAWIFFEPNSAVMWEGSKAAMKALVDRIRGVDSRCYRLGVAAHLDGAEAIGDRSELSQGRMEAVDSQLASAGIRITMRKDHAYDQPLVQTPLGVGEAQNRRVVVRWSRPESGRWVCDPPEDPPSPCGPRCKFVLADGTGCGDLH